MPFDTKPIKMTVYSFIRILIFVGAIYVMIVYVIPAWRGAYHLYALGDKPDLISVTVQDQGIGLSFPPLAATINTTNDTRSFLWFYGRVLRTRRHTELHAHAAAAFKYRHRRDTRSKRNFFDRCRALTRIPNCGAKNAPLTILPRHATALYTPGRFELMVL